MLPKIEGKNNGKLINLLLQNRKDFLISYSVFVRAFLHIPTPMRFVIFCVLQRCNIRKNHLEISFQTE